MKRVHMRHMLFARSGSPDRGGRCSSAAESARLKELGQRIGSRSRDVVAPGTEGRQQFSRFIKGHIAVHHTR